MATKIRPPHLLKPNKTTAMPWQAIFVDTETATIPLPDGRQEQVFKLGWAAFWRRSGKAQNRYVEWYQIRSLDAFWDWVEKKIRPNNKLYIFTYNQYFDISILKGQKSLRKRDWTPGKPYYRNKTAIHKWEKDDRKLCLLDVGNYFPGNLQSLGHSIGLERIEVNYDTCTVQELSDACHNHTEILLKAMTSYFDFIQHHDLGSFRQTAPSQAMTAFRHRFMSHPIWLHSNPEVFDLERESYHGGRVAALSKGHLTDGPFYKLDYNSAYPSVYGHYDYPSDFRDYRTDISLALLERYLAKYCVIATVDIGTDEAAYPILRKEKLYFPVGNFTATLTTRELLYALSKGHIQRVRKVAVYKQAKLFASFVKELYALRLKYKKTGNTGYELMVKLMLNGFYGKWGQRRITQEELRKAHPDIMRKRRCKDYQTGVKGFLITYGGTEYLETKEGESFDSFAAIAAHITADLRMKLWEDIQLAGLENSFYYDTDSLFVNKAGYLNLESRIDPEKLGYLKVEGIEDEMTINVAKDYVFGSKVKRKGVPRRAIETCKNTYVYNQFQGWAGAMNRDEVGRVITRSITKKLSHQVTRGKLRPDGRIHPLNFPGDIYHILEPTRPETTIEALQESFAWTPKIDQRIILQVWDYKKGVFKKARDKDGKLVHIIYSKWDSRCTELGFANVDEFTQAVIRQVEDRSGQELTTKKRIS